jgi:hypothetical protein
MDKTVEIKLTSNEERKEMWGPPNIPLLFNDEDWIMTHLFTGDKAD